MYSSPKMQRIIEAIAKRHAVDLTKVGSYLRLENPPFMPLVIEVIAPYQVAVQGHAFTQNGDVMYDIEIVFFIRYGPWIAIRITRDSADINRRDLAELSDDGAQLRRLRVRAQQSVGQQAEIWASDIRAQGYLEYGRLRRKL